MIDLTPGVQLRANDLGDCAGLVVVASLVPVVTCFEQVVQVCVPVLRPAGGTPLPVLGGVLVSADDLVAA